MNSDLALKILAAAAAIGIFLFSFAINLPLERAASDPSPIH